MITVKELNASTEAIQKMGKNQEYKNNLGIPEGEMHTTLAAFTKHMVARFVCTAESLGFDSHVMPILNDTVHETIELMCNEVMAEHGTPPSGGDSDSATPSTKQ